MTSASWAWDCSNQQTQVRCDHCVAFFGHHSQSFILFHSPFIRIHVTCVGFLCQLLVPDYVPETELTNPGLSAGNLGRRKLGVIRFHD